MKNGAIAVVVVGAGMGAVLTLAFDDHEGVMQTVARSRALGWTALSLLVGSIVVSVFARRAAWRTWALRYRRALGVGAAIFAVVHASYTINGPLVSDLALMVYEPMFRAGGVTLLVLVLLGITSSSRVVRWLHVRRWRDLHVLVYVAGLTALHHVALSPHAPVDTLLVLSGVVGAALIARVLLSLRRF